MLFFVKPRRLRAEHINRVGVSLITAAMLAVVLASFSSAAWADGGNWYVAADLGQSRFTGIGTAGNPIYPSSFSRTGTGYQLSAGYQFSEYLGLEAGYVNLGKVTGSGTFVPYTPCGPACPIRYNPNSPPPSVDIVNADLKAHGWTLEVVGTFPIIDGWAAFVRTGAIRVDSELNTSTSPCNDCMTPLNARDFVVLGTTSDSTSDWDAIYGLGLQWSFASDWAARLSWDRYASLGHDLPMGKFNVNLTSLGIVYQF